MWFRLFFALIVVATATVNAQAPATQTKQAPDPHGLVLVGDRFKPLKYDEMTSGQKIMIDHLLAGERAGANGPFNVLLRSPEVGDLGQQFGGAMRFRTGLPRTVSEVIIIMTGRFWMAQYEWYSHRNAALQNGVAPAVVDAIAAGKRPTGMPREMEIAYNLIDELLTTHQVTDTTFNAAKDQYGERGVVDIVGLSGWYGLVSMLLNVDRYPLPQGVQPGLLPLEQPTPPVVGMGFATPMPGVISPAAVKSSAKGKEFTMEGGSLPTAELGADDTRAEEDDRDRDRSARYGSAVSTSSSGTPTVDSCSSTWETASVFICRFRISSRN